MGTNDRGRLSIDPSSNTYIEYDPGDDRLFIILEGREAANVKFTEAFAYGTIRPNIPPPSGGTTVDAEARGAINSILDALVAYRITEQS